MKQWFFALLAVLCFSCDDIIEVANISNRTVTVLAPTDNSVLTLTDINFSWNSIEDAEQYRLQIATPSFEMANQIVLDTIITDTNFTHTLTSGSFQWRVRAENSGFETAYTTQSFTVED